MRFPLVLHMVTATATAAAMVWWLAYNVAAWLSMLPLLAAACSGVAELELACEIWIFLLASVLTLDCGLVFGNLRFVPYVRKVFETWNKEWDCPTVCRIEVRLVPPQIVFSLKMISISLYIVRNSKKSKTIKNKKDDHWKKTKIFGKEKSFACLCIFCISTSPL